MSVVVGFTPTDEGRAALSAALNEAALRSTSLRILGSPPADNSVQAHELAATLASAAELGVEVTVRELGPDEDPGDALVDASYEDEVQLVVIGVRRRSPVGKLFLGSNAQRVLLEANCPVHAVKASVNPQQ